MSKRQVLTKERLKRADERAKRPGKVIKYPAFEPCANCCEGWTVQIGRFATGARMVRCSCWIAHQAKIRAHEAAK